MKRNWRAGFYVAAGAALMIALLAAPGVWATPGQQPLNQTVPTRTPTAGPVQPTSAAATVQPGPGTAAPGPGTGTVAPGPRATTAPGGAAATATRAPASQTAPLTLTIVADRQQVWPDATVTFTLTVTNTSRTALRQVTVEDVLATGLAPGDVVSGDAEWDGSTLRATAASLAPNGKLTIVYTARVTATTPGEAIITRVSATAAGGARANASLTLVLPPSELPETGGRLAP